MDLKKNILNLCVVFEFPHYFNDLVECHFIIVEGLNGPADAIIKHIGNCESDEKFPALFNIHRTKYNRTHDTINCNISTDFDFDDNTGLYINVGKWGDGGFKPNIFVINESSMCKYFMKWGPKFTKDIMRELGQPEKCPVKGGSYTLKNYLLTYELPPVLLYGSFDCYLYFRRNNTNMLCLYMMADIVPKKTLGELVNMSDKLFSVVIFLCAFYGSVTLLGVLAVNELLGPGDLNILYVRECDNADDYPVKLFVKKAKLNRTHEVYDANITTDYDIDKTISVHVNVAKKGDGGYKPNYFILDEKNCCEYFQKIEKDEFVRIMGIFKQPPKCPLKAGVYVMNRHILTIKNAASMLYGDFKAEIKFKKGDTELACLSAGAIVKPISYFG